jgi:hypothetical protein
VKLRASLCALLGTLLTIIVPSISLAQGVFGAFDALSEISIQPTICIGYLFPNKPNTLSIDMSGDSLVSIKKIKQSFNVEGVWTELVIPIRTPSPLGFAVDFGWLFSTSTQSTETYNLASSGYAERTWRTSTQMCHFEVAATYRFFPSLSGILGFRYDSLMTNFFSPQWKSTNGPTFAHDNSAGLTLSADIPFFGLLLERNIMYGGNVRAGVTWLPTLAGQLEYKEVVRQNYFGTDETKIYVANGVSSSKELSSGHFLETVVEVSAPIYRGAHAGAFLKYSGIDGSAPTASATIGYSKKDNTITAITSENAEKNFNMSSWIVGGTFSLNF